MSAEEMNREIEEIQEWETKFGEHPGLKEIENRKCARIHELFAEQFRREKALEE
jgi:hypothetical protein